MTSLPEREQPPVPAAPLAAAPADSRSARRRARNAGPSGAIAASAGLFPSAAMSSNASDRVVAALGEAQSGVSLLQTAAAILDEVAFLLRRLRTVAVQATDPEGTGVKGWRLQEQAFGIVAEISEVSRSAQFNGSPLFNGELSRRTVWVGSAGQSVELDLPLLDGPALGIERPWGRANKARSQPAQLISWTGTLPSGTYRIDGHDVFDEGGELVGRYDQRRIDFGNGVTATFDVSLYYRDEPNAAQAGIVSVTSVLSVRNPRAAERAVSVVGEALLEVARRRGAIAAARGQLEDVIVTLGLVTASSRETELPDSAPSATAMAQGAARAVRGLEADAFNSHAHITARLVSKLLAQDVETGSAELDADADAAEPTDSSGPSVTPEASEQVRQ